MDNFEIRNRTINLGKALVEELGLNPGVDTLARWMAHYIAEQMTIAENATGNDKIAAEQHCFETILKVWQHRATLPNGRRPFESFEPIFRALERLDPENITPYYYSHLPSPESRDSNENVDEVQQWLAIAKIIDTAARICLEYVFLQAASKATDEKTITWLVNASDLAKSDDISLIIHFVHEDSKSEDKEDAKRQQEAKTQRLKSRIEKLDTFINFTQELRAAFLNDLETMSGSDSSAGEFPSTTTPRS